MRVLHWSWVSESAPSGDHRFTPRDAAESESSRQIMGVDHAGSCHCCLVGLHFFTKRLSSDGLVIL